MNDHNPASAIAMRMGILFSGTSVGGPARVAHAVEAIDRGETDGFFKISQLAWCAAQFELAPGIHDGNARGIVSAILQAAKPIEDERDHLLRADISDNSAHD
jgi:hypothetical protein